MSVLIAEEGTFISLPSAGRKRMPVPITFPESRSPEWSQTSSTSNCGGFVKWIQATCGRASVRFPNFVLTRNSLLRTVPISESPPRPMITSEAAMAPPVREASSVDETAGPNARHRRIEPYRVKRGVHQRGGEALSRLAALPPRQRRVLGVLIEKAKTPPAAYPMSVNAIVAGCNQKSNRDPLSAYDDIDVEKALDELRTLGVVSELDWLGRVSKYKHHAYE